MIYGKEECKKLASDKATVLVLDGYTENATPILVVRKVIGCGGSRSGKGDSHWYVKLDKPFDDGCDGAYLSHLLGIKTEDVLDVAKLSEFLNTRCRHLTVPQKHMLISDAVSRLKDSYQ